MSQRVLRCYYEVLEIERKASFDEIRKAYKIKSLKYHPDRNYGNQEEAAIKFKEVHNAYTVLSDENERAWYDSHREQILRGGDGSGAPDELNIYEYFTNACFDEYDDAEKGFFTVYAKVIDTLIEEETDYEDKAKAWPGFGNSEAEYPHVQKFYAHWKNFSSYKTFAWKDEYKVTEMEDRYSRRMADRINMKARAVAKKEYVQTVQNLATFLYRRDPRVKVELERQEAEAEAKAVEREALDVERQRRRREANKRVWQEAAVQEARKDAERAARGEAMDGTAIELLYEKERQAREMMKGKVGCGTMTGFAMLEGDDEDDGKPQHFNCPACKKTFKAQKQFDEHVNSNKHKTKLKQLAGKGIDVTALMSGKKADAADEDEDKDD